MGRSLRAALYLRVSTTRQAEEGVSLDLQEERCQLWAKARAAQVVDVYRDEGLSGKNTQRPAYQRMLADLRAGKFDVLVALKIDRLSRSVADFCQLVQEAEAHGVDVVAVTQEIDTTTPAGRLLRNLLASFGQFEREMIAERVSETMQSAARKGRYCGGRIPFGYRQKQGGGLEPNPDTRAIVSDLFRLYASGKSATDLVRHLRESGRPLSHTTVIRILRNPIYLGKQQWAGEVLAGSHMPIVDQRLYDRVQPILERNAALAGGQRRTHKEHYEYLLDGLIFCGICGKHLTTWTARGKMGKRYFYYGCTGNRRGGTCKSKPFNAQELDRFMAEKVAERLADPSSLHAAMAAQKKTAAADLKRLAADKRSAEASASNAQQRMNNLMALAADGEWGPGDAADLRAEMAKKRATREDAERRLAVISQEMRAAEARAGVERNAEELGAEIQKVLGSSDHPRRRRLLRSALRKVTVNADSVEVLLYFGTHENSSGKPGPSEFARTSIGGG